MHLFCSIVFPLSLDHSSTHSVIHLPLRKRMRGGSTELELHTSESMPSKWPRGGGRQRRGQHIERKRQLKQQSNSQEQRAKPSPESTIAPGCMDYAVIVCLAAQGLVFESSTCTKPRKKGGGFPVFCTWWYCMLLRMLNGPQKCPNLNDCENILKNSTSKNGRQPPPKFHQSELMQHQ